MFLSLLLLGTTPLFEAIRAQDRAPLDHPVFTSQIREIRDRSFDQEHIRLAIRFEPETGHVYGTAKLRLRPLDPEIDQLVLDAEDLEIYSIQIGVLDSLSRSTTYSDSLQQLIVDLDTLHARGVPFEVQVTYRAQPVAGLMFRKIPAGDTTRAVHIWTDKSMTNKRFWIPLIADPGDRMTSELIVTVPPELSAWAPGRLTEQMQTEDGMNLFHYVQDQVHSPEDIGLFVGRFRRDVRSTTLPSGYSLPLQYWLPASASPDDVSRSFAEIPDILSFFSEYLDFTYPWPVYSALVFDRILLSDHSFTGLTVFNDRVLKDEKALLDDPETLRLASNLARQWYSHLVHVDFEADLWLTESLSRYLALLYIRENQGEGPYYTLLHEYARAYFAESEQYRRPLVWNRWALSEDLKDAHSYAKGVWILHTIQEILGEDAFKSLLQRFTRQYAFETTNTDDFMRAIRTESGDETSVFFDDWVYSAGHPELAIGYQYDVVSESLYVAFDQMQEGYLVPPVYPLDMDVETYSISGPSTFPVTITEADQLISLPLSLEPRYVIAGPDYSYLIDITIDQDVSAWIAQLRYASNPISQLRAIEALEAFTSDPALLIGLQSALRSRPSQEIRAGILDLIAQLPPSDATKRTLRDAFNGELPLVQRTILRGLSRFDDPAPAIDLAMEAAQTGNSYSVQAEGVRTLARVSAPGAYDIVRSALITPSHRDVIRQSALRSLFDLDITTRERIDIARQFSAPDYLAEVRLAALEVLTELAALENQQSLRILRSLIGDEEPAIRGAVISALEKVGGEEDLDVLKAHLEVEQNARLHLRSLEAIDQIQSRQEERASS